MLYKISIALALTVAHGADYTTVETSGPVGSTCYDLKAAYQDSECCNTADGLAETTDFFVSPPPPTIVSGTNVCEGAKDALEAATIGYGGAADDTSYFANENCTGIDKLVQVLEQAGANVTAGYVGEIDALGAGRSPITDPYYKLGMCPVNVHWHLGAEHYSAGEFDEFGTGPSSYRRRMAAGAEVREGFLCSYYDEEDPVYTTEYDWKYCVGMEVGQTYEVHWPHSYDGACGTPNQFQTPFYDGVFCGVTGGFGTISLDPLNTWEKIGVQAQIFTIVNDESYYWPDLMRGMIVDGEMGADIAKYTGSTTGTSRDNEICSKYTPITWQVDRKCHIVSASTFDKMCKDMLEQRDDMTDDLYAHGARELVADEYAANNLERRKLENKERVRRKLSQKVAKMSPKERRESAADRNRQARSRK